MTLHEYLQGMKGKTAAVIGLGVSNRPLVELLARNGVKVIACDRKERAALGGADRTFIYCAVSAPRSAYSRPIILRPPPVPFFRSGPDAPPRGRARFLRGKARARG